MCCGDKKCSVGGCNDPAKKGGKRCQKHEDAMKKAMKIVSVVMALLLCRADAPVSAQVYPGPGTGGSSTVTATDISTATTCVDAGATDAYACNLPVAPTIAAGFCATFNANTSNTGASTINFNSTGAVSIKRKTPTITTDTVSLDIRADQWVTVCHDGTNFQMQSVGGIAISGGDSTNCTAGSLVSIQAGSSVILCNNNIGYGVNSANQLRNVGLNLNSATMSLSINSEMRSAYHTYLVTNAMVVALGATTTGNVAAFTLPAKMIVENMYVIITGAAAGPATVTMSCGRTGAAYIDYIVASDAKAAANTIYGNDAAERGANLGFDMPSYTGTTTVNCQFVSTVGNLDTVTGFSATVMVKAALGI